MKDEYSGSIWRINMVDGFVSSWLPEVIGGAGRSRP